MNLRHIFQPLVQICNLILLTRDSSAKKEDVEMYDYEVDPLETKNVYHVATYQKDAAQMKKLFE